MNMIFKSQKRYERDCSPWKHISQRATKHEKRSIQSLLDHHRWTSLHEKKRKEVNHYYIVILKCCSVQRKKKVDVLWKVWKSRSVILWVQMPFSMNHLKGHKPLLFHIQVSNHIHTHKHTFTHKIHIMWLQFNQTTLIY